MGQNFSQCNILPPRCRIKITDEKSSWNSEKRCFSMLGGEKSSNLIKIKKILVNELHAPQQLKKNKEKSLVNQYIFKKIYFTFEKKMAIEIFCSEGGRYIARRCVIISYVTRFVWINRYFYLWYFIHPKIDNIDNSLNHWISFSCVPTMPNSR